jgi:uncharacterized lipoprotein YajG
MGNFKEYFNISGITHLYPRIMSRHKTWCMAFAVTFLVGCAPTIYSVDMKYVPTKAFPQQNLATQPASLTVAAFQDMRKVNDTMLIGRVVKLNGDQVPVLPKFVKPSKAVTKPIKEFLTKAGYKVAGNTPEWDLKESSIDKKWGPILVGGSIDEMDIVCRNSLTATKYSAKVNLTIYFADVLKGKIFYTVTTNSSTSLDHVLFSKEMMEQQLNTALSDAIEKIFEDRDITNIINKGAKQNP